MYLNHFECKSMCSIDSAKTIATNEIDRNKDLLEEISSTLWNNPELSFEEHDAHEYLTTVLEKNGFQVFKHHPLNTSFVASFGKDKSGTTVGICCEYDALPGLGHACGHNLIAECSIAAALAVKAVLEIHNDVKGRVIVYGTPAEEIGGGKSEMMKHDAFEECDFCIMSHPSQYNLPDPIMIAVSQFKVIFKGKPAHAAAAPWEGINALDAAVACYNNVSMLRQQMKPTSRVHCVILKGGDVPNIIPEISEMAFFVRGVTDYDMKILKRKVEDCAKGAAIATGCECEFVEGVLYNALQSNNTLVQLYTNNAKSLGIPFDYNGSKQGGSTDMGNVSTIKPSIHPKFRITSKTGPHTKGFCEAAILKVNQEPTLLCAKSLAMTAVDVILRPDLLDIIRREMNNSNQ